MNAAEVIPDAISYQRVSTIGHAPYHRVQLFNSYTRERGCEGPVLLRIEGTIAECLKEMRKWPISKQHVQRVHRLMSHREDGIIPSDLNFYRF